MDPITLVLIVAGFYLSDRVSSGLLRAELGGGARGAAGGAVGAWFGRRKRASKRRWAKRQKSKFGRLLNAALDEVGAFFKGAGRGYKVGRKRGHAKRRERWAKKPPWWQRWFGSSQAPKRDLQASGPQTSGPNGKRVEPGTRRGPLGEHVGPNGKRVDPKAGPVDPKADPEADPEREGQTSNPDPEQTPNAQPEAAADLEPSTPNERTSNVSDITTAPAAIRAWDEIKQRFEELKAQLDQLADDAAATRDQMGDFAVGSEGDAASAISATQGELIGAEEKVDAVLADLHEEWDEHIAAAEGRQAGAHQPFQEV